MGSSVVVVVVIVVVVDVVVVAAASDATTQLEDCQAGVSLNVPAALASSRESAKSLHSVPAAWNETATQGRLLGLAMA